MVKQFLKRRYDLILLFVALVVLTLLRVSLSSFIMMRLITYLNLVVLILIASIAIMITEHLTHFSYTLDHRYVNLSWKLIAISALSTAFLETLSYLSSRSNIDIEALKFLVFCVWLDAYWLFYRGIRERRV